MTPNSNNMDFKSSEASRKLIHIINGFWAFFIPFIPRILALLIIFIAFIFVFILARPDTRFGSLFKKSFQLMARKEDWKRGYLHGPSIYVIMVAFCILFVDYRIAGAIFAILAFGDGFATLVGLKYGKYMIYNYKTLEGMVAFVIFSLPTSLIAYFLTNQFNTPNGGLDLFFTVILPQEINLIPMILIE